MKVITLTEENYHSVRTILGLDEYEMMDLFAGVPWGFVPVMIELNTWINRINRRKGEEDKTWLWNSMRTKKKRSVTWITDESLQEALDPERPSPP